MTQEHKPQPSPFANGTADPATGRAKEPQKQVDEFRSGHRRFASAREAIGHCVAVLTRGRMTRSAEGRAPGSGQLDEWAAIAVLALLRRVGAAWDSDLGAELLAWSTTPDDVSEGLSERAGRLLVDLRRELADTGLIVECDALPQTGWRFMDLNGSVVACCVVASPGEPGVYVGSKAVALARARAEGGIVQATRARRANSTSPDDARQQAQRAASGGTPVRAITRQIEQALGVSPARAKVLRRSWGILGHAGRPRG